MSATTYRQRKTPGVYVTELDAFPPSVVGVQTAVPAFIGYTQTAEISGKPVYFKPVKIASLADFEAVFGGGYEPKYDIVQVINPTSPDAYDFRVLETPPGTAWVYYKLVQTTTSRFNLYNSLRLFYANGGGTAYIVSTGAYTSGAKKVELAPLQQGLSAIAEQVGPTMLVVPDAVLLDTEANFGTLSTDMLKQCGAKQDRVAILDVYGTEKLKQTSATFQADLDAAILAFRAAVGSNFLNYGMAYFPFVNASVVQASEIDYTNFNITDAAQLALLQSILNNEADRMYTGAGLVTVKGYITAIDPAITDPNDPTKVTPLNNDLNNALPLLPQIEGVIANMLNLLPASGGMAGVYTLNDQSKGVWTAPANTALSSVISPSVKLSDAQQGDLNVPLDGKAVDVLREFVGRGTVVWGARTLDGNSNDWRYVQVRRTLIYIEQSVKSALDQFVFAPNDGNTWVTVTSTVSNFLQGLWSQGGLMGATASEAYTVQCGLGSTMTAIDVLEGYMIVQITVQMIRPAEFIELTFKQKMEGLG